MNNPNRPRRDTDLGVRLRFFRDLAHQFAPLTRSNGTDITNVWTVLGSLDYMVPASLQSLQELSNASDSPKLVRINGRSVGGASELLLFPILDGRHAAFDNAVEHQRVKNFLCGIRNSQQVPLLSFYRISFSSVAYDLPDGPLRGVEILGAAQSLIRGKAEEMNKHHSTEWFTDQVTVWTTLGGPDLVCLATPSTPTEIGWLTEFLDLIRQTRLPELLSPVRLRMKAPDAHAFATVQATLCYGPEGELNEHFSQDDFKTKEIEARLRYPCRITVDPGHELLLVQRLITRLKLTESEIRTITTWGFRSLLIELRHLSHLVDALRLLNEDAPGLQVPDISACRTTVGIVCDLQNLAEQPQSIHPGLILNPVLLDRLRHIEATFKTFADTLLAGGSFGYRLQQVFTNLESSLHRNDRAVAIRDVLPFVDQLARCFEEIEVWKSYTANGQGEATARLVREFSALLNHLWHALRNRIEQRGEPLDPTFPNTLEYGASKLVNAYTVAVWTASEIITRTSDIRRSDGVQAACGSEYFGACVSVNIEGRVFCNEAFIEVRESLQKQRGITHLACREDKQWNFPLLLLTISGPVLFHPEMAFVHCLHEVAEFTRWFELPPSEPIRTAALKFADVAFTSAVASLLRQHRIDHGQSVIAEPETLPSRIRWTYLVGLSYEQLPQHFDRTKVKKIAGARFKGQSARSVFDLLWQGFSLARNSKPMLASGIELSKNRNATIRKPDDLDQHFTVPDWEQNLQAINRFIPVALNRLNVNSASRGLTLTNVLAEWGSLLNEVVADAAMVNALRYILEQEGLPCSTDELSQDLSRIFTSIISSIVVYMPQPAREQAVDMAVTRWYIQFYSSVGSSADFAKCLRSNEAVVKRSYPSFSADTWLTATLPWLDNAGGIEKSDFLLWQLGAHMREGVRQLSAKPARFSDYSDDSVCKNLLSNFARLWTEARNANSDNVDRARLAFVQMLWIKATRFFSADLISSPTPNELG